MARLAKETGGMRDEKCLPGRKSSRKRKFVDVLMGEMEDMKLGFELKPEMANDTDRVSFFSARASDRPHSWQSIDIPSTANWLPGTLAPELRQRLPCPFKHTFTIQFLGAP